MQKYTVSSTVKVEACNRWWNIEEAISDTHVHKHNVFIE